MTDNVRAGDPIMPTAYVRDYRGIAKSLADTVRAGDSIMPTAAAYNARLAGEHEARESYLNPDGMPHCRNCGWNCKPGCPYADRDDETDDRGRFDLVEHVRRLTAEVAELAAVVVKLTEQQESWQTHALAVRDEIRPYLDQVMPVVEKVSRMLNPFGRVSDAVNEGKVSRRGRR